MMVCGFFGIIFALRSIMVMTAMTKHVYDNKENENDDPYPVFN